MCKDGVKNKKYLTKSSRVRVNGKYTPIKDYLHTMLSQIQGDAFDMEAFDATFQSKDWKSLCDSTNMYHLNLVRLVSY